MPIPTRLLMSVLIMSVYSLPFLLVLGLVGYWLGGAGGLAGALLLSLTALYRALRVKPRLSEVS